VKKSTVREWIRIGYLESKRQALRSWVPENSISDLLSKQQATVSFNHVPTDAYSNGSVEAHEHSNGNQQLPDQLREQRQALLNFVKQPDSSDGEI
jgi:hypothetical protein